MRVRAVDINNDWTFGRGFQDYKSSDRAIAQNVKTRVQSFYRDCFFDMEAGIDWFNLLGYGTQEFLYMSIQETVINTEGVTGINSVNIDYDRENRTFTIKYDIQTIYSKSYIDEFAI